MILYKRLTISESRSSPIRSDVSVRGSRRIAALPRLGRVSRDEWDQVVARVRWGTRSRLGGSECGGRSGWYDAQPTDLGLSSPARIGSGAWGAEHHEPKMRDRGRRQTVESCLLLVSLGIPFYGRSSRVAASPGISRKRSDLRACVRRHIPQWNSSSDCVRCDGGRNSPIGSHQLGW